MIAAAPSTAIGEQLEEALALLARCPTGGAATRAETLYAYWYARPRPGIAVPRDCPPDLAEMLRAAHACGRRWEDGWHVDKVGPRGQAIVRRGGELRMLDRSDYSPLARPGLLPRRGDEVAVTGRRDRLEPRDGWWRTAGAAWPWTAPPGGLVRLYVQREIAELPAFVAAITALLAGEAEPWLLKCATDPAQHARRDAVVVYLTPGTVRRRADALAAFARPAREADGPPLTLPVAPGLAAAFDPGGDESFGSHRCRLIAEAAGDSIAAVAARFVRDGVDPSRPWARVGDPLLPWEC